MTRFNDPRYLETELANAHKGGLVIDRDRLCKGCPYDLTGLRYGARCPECGTVIRFGRSVVVPARDRLQDAPAWYIRIVQAAFASMTIGCVGVVGLALAASGAVGGAAHAALWLLPLAALWVAGVAVVCAPKPSTEMVKRTARDDLRWRIAAGASQAMWLFAGALVITPTWALQVGPVVLNDLLAWAAVAIGLVGLGATAWVVAGFHEWMQDDDGAGHMRRRTCWLIGIAAVLLLGGSFRLPLGLPSLGLMVRGLDILPIIALWLVAMMLWSFVGLTRMAGWSLRAKRVDGARSERLRAQRKAETAAEQERLANAPIDPAPTYWRAPTPDRKTGHGGPERVAGSDRRR